MAGLGIWRWSSWQDGRLSLPVLGQPSCSGLHSQKSRLLCSPRAQEAKKGRWLQQDHFKTGHKLLETFLERTGSLAEGLSSVFWHVGGSGKFPSLVGILSRGFIWVLERLDGLAEWLGKHSRGSG